MKKQLKTRDGGSKTLKPVKEPRNGKADTPQNPAGKD